MTSIAVGTGVLQRPDAGGHAWALGAWALGLQRLGHDVTWLDRSAGEIVQLDPGALGRDAPLVAREHRPSPADVDCVLDVMGFLGADAPHSRCSAFVDVDPGYPQMWTSLGLADPFRSHADLVTIGENIGAGGCAIPTCGRRWLTTPPPVVLDAWPVTEPGHAYTSVATWRNPYGTVTYDGATYGSRVHEFRAFVDLPRLVDAHFELALDIDAAEVDDLRRLEAGGWTLVDPRHVARTPGAYRAYVQGSRGEFCVAQQMYVASRSGWLSDRSLVYLASGKPVLHQDTGFTARYPTGEGLIAFSTLEEAAAGIEQIEGDYARHSAAARALAEEYFDSATVLSRLLDRLGVGARAA